MKWPSNPFVITPITSKTDFYGRDEHVAILTSSIQDRSIGVVLLRGPRRIGKTSLLKRAKALADDQNAVVHYIDLRTAEIHGGDRHTVTAILLKLLGQSLCQKAGVPVPAEIPAEPSSFRRDFLSRLIAEAGERRLVLLFDETEELEAESPASVEDLLDAFQPEDDVENPPLLIMGWGRGLGTRSSSALVVRLRAAKLLEVKPFTYEVTTYAPDRARVYRFTDEAKHLLWEITKGHPYYIAALNHALFDRRQAAQDTRVVDGDELMAIIPSAHKLIHTGLLHAVGQLSAVQTVLCRAMANLAAPPPDDDRGLLFQQYVTLPDIAAKVAGDGDRYDLGELRAAIPGLVDNAVLESEGETYRIRSPFFGYWLKDQTYETLVSGNKTAAMQFAEKARAEIGAGHADRAFAASLEALERDPRLVEARIIAGDYEAQRGNLDAAIKHYKIAALTEPATVRTRLLELLRDRVRQATTEKHDPRTWYFAILELDETAATDPAIADLVTTYYLDRWEQEIDRNSVDAAAAAFHDVAKENPRGWRRVAAQRYAEVMKRCMTSEEGMRLALASVRDAFDVITREPFEGAYSTQSDDLLRQLELMLDDPKLIGEVTEKIKKLPHPPWWTATIDILDRGMAKDLDNGEAAIPLDVLSRLAWRVPEGERRQLHRCYARHLPRRLPQILRERPDDAFKAVRLLTDVEEPPFSVLLQVLQEHILTLPPHDYDRLLAFFRHGAGIYALILNAAASAPDRNGIYDQVALHIDVIADLVTPKNAKGDTDWTLFIHGWSSFDQWKELIAREEIAGRPGAEKLSERLKPPAEVMQKAVTQTYGEAKVWAKGVGQALGESFGHVQELDVHLPGIPPEYVRIYRGRWNDEDVNFKVYRLTSRKEEEREFLRGLWESERRVLFDIATRRRGRALTRLKFAQWNDDKDHLVVVTEAVGPSTLRDWLDHGQGGTAAVRRGDVWRNIHALLEAVASLHDARYLHRTIRPESIYLKGEGFRGDVKLGNYEWSVYVHSLADRATRGYTKERVYFDRYSAPEVLAGSVGGGGASAGENFGSDIYSVGLVLFEILVRRLSKRELGFYPAERYVFDEHVQWLEGIREEVRRRVESLDLRLLLLEMLHPNVGRRLATLNDAVELARQLAQGTREIQLLLDDPANELRVVTTLHRNTAESIENYLKIHIDTSEVGASQQELSAFVSHLISGARVYRNGGNSVRPLVIEGLVRFTLRPYEYGGQALKTVPYITVATAQDWSVGPELARLPDTVRVEAASDSADFGAMIRHGEAWRSLFDAAAEMHDDLPREQREFHSILRVTAAVERALWDSYVVPYRLVSQTPPDAPTEAVIEARPDEQQRMNVGAFVAQQADIEQMTYEVSTRNRAIDRFEQDREWVQTFVDVNRNRVHLHRDEPGAVIPRDGYLRPYSLYGNRAIHRRRQELLRQLEDDVYLLTAVTDPLSVRMDSTMEAGAFHDADLDADKRRIVKQFAGTHPLFLVQGPPGTGKTTLAAEVILQTLEKDPTARILVAAQAHDPLNHLLLRVDEAIKAERSKADKKSPFARRQMMVRLMREDRPEQEGDEGIKEFHPSFVAKRVLEQARAWTPESDSRIDESLLSEWRRFVDSQSAAVTVTMQRRVERSANLVFVTANDRAVGALTEDQTFDLLIFEESAKAYPLEVLAPMRLARRWLLIGDHEQLPPFNIDAFKHELIPRIGVAIEQQELLRRGQQRRSESLLHFALSEDSADKAYVMSEFFEWLHQRGQPRGFADALTHQWRMHPDIRAMLSDTGYYKLVDGDADMLRKKRRHGITTLEAVRKRALVWIDTPAISNELTLAGAGRKRSAGRLPEEKAAPGGGYYNPFELAVVAAFMRKVWMDLAVSHDDVVLLSPYRAQVRRLASPFRHGEGVRSATVDSFQGRQADIVIVSLVRNNERATPREAYGFLTSKERAGVMFSRAESLLVVVGCSAHFLRDGDFHLARAFRHIQKHGAVLDANDLLDRADYDRLIQAATKGARTP